MSHKFEVCCFDSELIGTRKECDRLSYEGKHTEFNLFYHQNNNKTFYCLNRKGLGEYWWCVVQDQETFCSEKCNACDVCKFLARVFVCLQNSYFFNPRNDVPYQPILWRVFNKNIHKKSQSFRLEIAKTVRSQNLVLNYGQTR